jgi:hypothetical protein
MTPRATRLVRLHSPQWTANGFPADADYLPRASTGRLPQPDWRAALSSVLRAICAWRELFSLPTGNYWQQVATHAA